MSNFFRCPEDIVILFKTDPETARSKAIEWLKVQYLQQGDHVHMPDADGVLQWMVVGERNH